MDIIQNIEKIVPTMEVMLNSHDLSVGATPSEVVYSQDKMKLLHYIPAVEKPYHVPILIVYALVNRYYILDLQPDKSVVRKLLDEGFDVYIIDWGYPTGMDRYLTIDDYVNCYIDDAVDRIRELSNSDRLTLLGVCQGGTLSVMYAALHPEKI